MSPVTMTVNVAPVLTKLGIFTQRSKWPLQGNGIAAISKSLL